MCNWLKIVDEGGNTIPEMVGVLLIARYPRVNTWSDPVYGWRAGDKFTRWPHDFPPTHFCYIAPPEDQE